jgi:hypothetical protein
MKTKAAKYLFFVLSLTILEFASHSARAWVNGPPPAPIDFHFFVNDSVYEGWTTRFCDKEEGGNDCVDFLMDCAFGPSNNFTCNPNEGGGFTCGCNIRQIYQSCTDQFLNP